MQAGYSRLAEVAAAARDTRLGQRMNELTAWLQFCMWQQPLSRLKTMQGSLKGMSKGMSIGMSPGIIMGMPMGPPIGPMPKGRMPIGPIMSGIIMPMPGPAGCPASEYWAAAGKQRAAWHSLLHVPAAHMPVKAGAACLPGAQHSIALLSVQERHEAPSHDSNSATRMHVVEQDLQQYPSVAQTSAVPAA